MILSPALPRCDPVVFIVCLGSLGKLCFLKKKFPPPTHLLSELARWDRAHALSCLNTRSEKYIHLDRKELVKLSEFKENRIFGIFSFAGRELHLKNESFVRKWKALSSFFVLNLDEA